MTLCNVCEESEAVGVAAMPGVPISFAYCRECLAANAHPYSIVVANTAMIGGTGMSAEWWQELVMHTLAHLKISPEQFKKDVDEEIAAALADEERMQED